VEPSVAEKRSSSQPSTKRKFDELSPPDEQNAAVLTDDQAPPSVESLRNAAPKPTEAVTEPSQESEAALSMELVKTEVAEAPKKKVKVEHSSSNGGSLGKYAAVALTSAVVGGVSVFAALAALPPGFFA